MERMSKEKESGILLGVGTAYLPVKEIKGEFYVKVSDFTRCMDSMRKELEEENKKLKEEIENHKQNIMQDELEIIPKLEEENKKLKEIIKDHQLYEEKLEHRIIEFEELLHGD